MRNGFAVIAIASFALLLGAQTISQPASPERLMLGALAEDTEGAGSIVNPLARIWGNDNDALPIRYDLYVSNVDGKTGKTLSVGVKRKDDGSILLEDETGAALATIWKDGYVTGDPAEALKRIVGFTGDAK